MSSAHRSRRERSEDAMALTMRTPAEDERALAEGRRQQAEMIDSAEADGTITAERAAEYRARYGLTHTEVTA